MIESPGRSVLAQRVQEWEQWSRSRRGARVLARWAQEDRALWGWTVDELGDTRSSPRTDAMQAALVGRAQAGEGPAVLALTVQLRPGLVALIRWARATNPALGSEAEVEAEVLATFGEVLAGHDLDRRPGKIAANLLGDTRQILWRSRARADRCHQAACQVATQGPRWNQGNGSAGVDPRVTEMELANTVSSAIASLSGTAASRQLTAEVAWRAWFLDQPSDQIADELGVGAHVVRTRLCRLRTAVRARG